MSPNVLVPLIVAGGLTLLSAIVLQLLIGYRKIHFRGPLHLKVHKWVAWAMLVFALFHAAGAYVYLFGI